MTGIFTLAICLAAPVNYAAAQTAEVGKRPYQARCVGCHGEDGTDGGHRPSIVDVRRSRATSLEAVRGLILKGIPDGSIPGFRISAEQARSIAAYRVTLKHPAIACS